jgi:hypothetical protein
MVDTVYRLPILKTNGKEHVYYYFKDPVKLFDFMCMVFTNNIGEKPKTVIRRTFPSSNNESGRLPNRKICFQFKCEKINAHFDL